jgi:hypothetical protein
MGSKNKAEQSEPVKPPEYRIRVSLIHPDKRTQPEIIWHCWIEHRHAKHDLMGGGVHGYEYNGKYHYSKGATRDAAFQACIDSFHRESAIKAQRMEANETWDLDEIPREVPARRNTEL